MQYIAKNKELDQIILIIQKLGYFQCRKSDGILSYKKQLSSFEKYPRFHIFLQKTIEGTHISIHLDQKSSRGQSNRDKEWSYKGQLVRNELLKIVKKIINTESKTNTFKTNC